jgi:hypothetical protein
MLLSAILNENIIDSEDMIILILLLIKLYVSKRKVRSVVYTLIIVDFSKLKFMQIICKAWVRTSQKTLKPINILSGKILKFFNVEATGTYSNY